MPGAIINRAMMWYRLKNAKLAVLCDFDGTISTVDTTDLILERFSTWRWEEADAEYHAGKLSYHKWMNMMEKPFSTLNATKEQIRSAIVPEARPRAHFGDLVEFCQNHAPLIIVSLGIDFIITSVLQSQGWMDKVEICMPKTAFTGKGIAFEYPELRYDDSLNIKDDMVRYYKTIYDNVVYIGDGTPDFKACSVADTGFAVSGSRLATLCRSNDIDVHEFKDFNEVTQVLKTIK